LELDDTSSLLLLDSTLPELEDSLFLAELEESSTFFELDDSTFLELEDASSLALLLEIASSFSLDEETSVSMPVSSFLEGPLELSSPQATKPTTAAQNPKAIRPLVKEGRKEGLFHKNLLSLKSPYINIIKGLLFCKFCREPAFVV